MSVPVIVVPAPGVGPREERYRLASVAAGAPLLLLAAPLLAPDAHGRWPIHDATREPSALVLAVGLLAWSLLTGTLSLTYGLRRRVPGTAAYAIPAVVYLLACGGIAFLAFAALLKVRRTSEGPAITAAAIACSAAVLVLIRGFFRGGWERWAQLVAGVWMGHGTLSVLIVLGADSPAADQPLGPWLLLFGLGALAPIVAWALWPRRGEAPLRRAAAPPAAP